MADDERELRETLDELERTLTALRTELDGRRRRRPPTVGELLRFTEQHTIPTVVATLEATIKALELFREFLRLAAPETDRPAADDSTRTVDPVSRLGDALADLRAALDDADLPPDAEARGLVEDARELSEEVERRIDGGTDADDETVEIAVDDADGTTDRESSVDVEAELESLREDVEDQDEGT